MSKRDFHTWLSNFRYSIADFGYYIDFNKVYNNIESIKIELNILNSLISSKNIEVDFENLIKKYPETLNLEETFDVLDDIYSIKDMQNGIMTEVFK